MKNTGVLFANDKHSERVKAVVANAHRYCLLLRLLRRSPLMPRGLCPFYLCRMGIRNTVITNYDARMFPRVMGGFNRVLLDAPCTGSGVIAKDPSVKTQKVGALGQVLDREHGQF